MNSLLSERARRNTPSSNALKAKDSSREKIMSKKLGARTQPCFTQLMMEMGRKMNRRTALCPSFFI